MSSDTPFSHAAFAEKVGIDYSLLSDYNWEAAKAFGVYSERGADVHELLADYNPANTRGAFLVDTDGTLRYVWNAPELKALPDPDELLEAARALVGT